MKIICQKENEYQLKHLLKEYMFLDIVIVEKGLDYEGLCYYFSMECINKLIDYLKELVNNKEWIVGVKDNHLEKILVYKIIYIEGFSKEAYVYTKDSVYIVKDKLYELEEKLKSFGFIRINKSMIVNIHEIHYIVPENYSRYALYMNNQIVLILSRSYVKEFKERLKMK